MSTALVLYKPPPPTKLRPCKVSGHDWWVYSITSPFTTDRTLIIRCRFCERTRAHARFRFVHGIFRLDIIDWVARHLPGTQGALLQARFGSELLPAIEHGAWQLVWEGAE